MLSDPKPGKSSDLLRDVSSNKWGHVNKMAHYDLQRSLFETQEGLLGCRLRPLHREQKLSE